MVGTVQVQRTVSREVKQSWQLLRSTVRMARIREAGVGVTKLIEKGLTHRFDGRKTLSRGVF